MLVECVRLASALALGATGALACSTGEPAAPESGAVVQATPTYHRDVAPILSRSCAKCHHEGGIGSFPLTSYEMARAMAPAMVDAVGARRMPPWGAHDTSECRPPLPWRDDERLSDDEIMTLQRWEASGAPEGDPSEAPAEIVPIQSNYLVTPTLEVEPREDFVPTVSSGDEFRCFVIDVPELEYGGYVSAVQVVAGNRRIVHHVSVYADINGVASSRAGADGSFDCSNRAGSVMAAVNGEQPSLSWLLAWAPGARPLQLPSNLGIKVHPRSKVILEIHYSMNGTPPEPDRTKLQLTMAPTKPEYSLSSWALGNAGGPFENGDGLLPRPEDGDDAPTFRIPAHARDHVEEMQQTFNLPFDAPVFAIRAHAHLAATDLKVDVVRDGASLCLLQDRWDFHWQRVYAYDAPFEHLPVLRAGDKVRVRCTYDNSIANRRLGTELRDRGLQPMDVFLGDGSLDEMCLAELLYVQKSL